MTEICNQAIRLEHDNDACNRDGTVTLEELEEFLFPEKSDDAANEIGIVLELTRKNLIRTISSTGAASVGSDDAILAEFIKLAKVCTMYILECTIV